MLSGKDCINLLRSETDPVLQATESCSLKLNQFNFETEKQPVCGHHWFCSSGSGGSGDLSDTNNNNNSAPAGSIQTLQTVGDLLVSATNRKVNHVR